MLLGNVMCGTYQPEQLLNHVINVYDVLNGMTIQPPNPYATASVLTVYTLYAFCSSAIHLERVANHMLQFCGSCPVQVIFLKNQW